MTVAWAKRLSKYPEMTLRMNKVAINKAYDNGIRWRKILISESSISIYVLFPRKRESSESVYTRTWGKHGCWNNQKIT